MTDTNTVIEIETKLMNELAILKDKNVGKERKKEARTNVRRYEKFMNDIDYKKINGHKYPERLKGLPDDKPMNFKELEKLIDSVPNGDEISRDYLIEHPIEDKNLQGLMINKS